MNKKLLRGELINNVLGEGDDWAKVGRGKHLEPGIVAYDNDDGSRTTYLLTREAIAKGRKSAVGKPIVGSSGGFDHMTVNPEDAEEGKYDGDVIDSYDGGDGWEWVNFLVRDAETKKKCRGGYCFSCAYVPTATDGKSGMWHNIPYDETIEDLEYTHFCVVPNPRYEGAEIELLNSKGGIVNKALKAILSTFSSPKELKEIANGMEEDERSRKERENEEGEKAKKMETAKSEYDEAMKNASSDEEKAAAEKAYTEAKKNAEGDPDPETTTLPPEPLGGGDVTPEPGVPGQATPAGNQPPKDNMDGETPEEVQLRKKKELEAKNNEEEDKRRQDELAAGEELNAYNAEMSKAWDSYGEDMVDELGMRNGCKMNDDGKLLTFANQPDEVKAAWKKGYEESNKNKMQRYNSIKVLANSARTKKVKAATKAAVDTALRKERFNTLRKAAEERGGSMGTPFVGVTTATQKEALGRERYGSRQE